MHEDSVKLLNLMFRPSESVCVHHNRYGYHSVPLEHAMSNTVTMVSKDSTRPNEYIDSSKMIFVALNPIKGFRKDENAYKYRNFLVEIDVGSQKEQMEYIKKLGMPYSAAVFSGNKSVHFLISLNEDLPNEDTYRKIAMWIQSIVTLADRNCKNPSRSIRLPGAMRDTGKMQELLELRGAVELTKLREWLMRWPDLIPKPHVKSEISTGDPRLSKLKPWIIKQLRDGIDFSKGRNLTWFSFGCNFSIADFSESDTMEILENYFVPQRDFTVREWKSAIRSGIRHVQNRK